MRGRYIALEGIEGAGKSTVQSPLAERLRGEGVEVVEVREPGGTAAGERIRSVLLDPEGTLSGWAEALLFAAARGQLAVEVIRPALDRGAWVVSDRSVYSSLAYQGGGRGLGVDAVRSVNAHALGDVWPDLVILLRVDALAGLDRQDVADRIGAEAEDFHATVARAYDGLAAAEPGLFSTVDASLPLEEVVELAYKAVRALE